MTVCACKMKVNTAEYRFFKPYTRRYASVCIYICVCLFAHAHIFAVSDLSV